MCELRLAIDNGGVGDQPDWVTVTVWGKDAETLSAHQRQGDQVGITGPITSSGCGRDRGGAKLGTRRLGSRR